MFKGWASHPGIFNINGNEFYVFLNIDNKDLIWGVNAQVQQIRVTDWQASANLNQWYHFTFIGDGTNIKLYIDGIQKGGTDSQVNFTPGSLEIGRRDSAAVFLDGYIDEFRVSKGIARWTENFTPPTQPYYVSLNAPTIALTDPSFMVGTDSTPTFRISGVADGYTVGLYKSLGSGCDVFLKYVVADATTVDITTDSLAEGFYSMYAKVENDGSDVLSPCSDEGASYAYDTSSPGVDSNVVLMIHGDGSGQSFEDSSSSQHTVNPINQSTQVSPASVGIPYPADNPGFENVMYFDGAGDYLSIPDSTDWDFGTGDFTIDFWYNQRVATTGYKKFLNIEAPGSYTGLLLQLVGSNALMLNIATEESGTWALSPSISTTIDIGTWYHIAIVRISAENKIRVFKDGTQIGTDYSLTGTFDSSPTVGVQIGGETGWNGFVDCYIDEFRISKGIARWTANFTVPIRPYYNIPDAPTIALYDPSSSPNSDNTPTFRISGVKNGYTVGLYQSTGSGCDTLLKQATATGTTIDITDDEALSIGTYSFYAKIENNGIGIASNCSSNGADYAYE